MPRHRFTRQGNDGRVNEAAEFSSRHMNYFPVTAGVERDCGLPGESAVQIDRKAVQRSEGRHRAELAIGEQGAELVFGGQTHLRKAECGPELLKIDQPAGW